MLSPRRPPLDIRLGTRSAHRFLLLAGTLLAYLSLGVHLAVAAERPDPAERPDVEQRTHSIQRLLSVKRLFDVPYATRGDQTLKADVYLPEGDGPFPAVLMVHGGAWMAGNKRTMRPAARIVASHGYTVVSINYRLAPLAKFPSQVDDCKAAVRWLRTESDKYKLDPRRVGGYGYSAGAHLVCMLGVTDPKDGLEGRGVPADAVSTRLQAVVAGGAPCDLEQIPLDARWIAYFLGGSRREVPEVYRRASPTTFVTPDDPPTFFFHGQADSLVPLKSPKALQSRLDKVGVATEFHEVVKKGHITTFLSEDPVKRAVKFLDRHLKGAR